MAHTHGASGRICPFKTLKECDENWRRVQHYHPDEPCVKWLKPGNSMETCALEAPRKAEFQDALHRHVAGESIGFCLACRYGGTLHGGPECRQLAARAPLPESAP